MNLIYVFLLLPLLGAFVIPFIKVGLKGIVAYSIMFLNAILSGYLAVQSLFGHAITLTFAGSYVTGPIPIRIDALSGWFIMIINLVFLTGSFYGLSYMKAYKDRFNNLSLHAISILFQHAALLSICAIQNGFVFLIAWEIMALSSFMVIIFESEHITTIKAGVNYLIHSHFSILMLTMGFIWVAHKTGSYDFEAITTYTTALPTSASLMLFLVLFIGFAIKSGFVPFHTWLPYAHPAAPSHVSGIMSGVVIKIGIFGILRLLLIIKTDLLPVGYIILILSIISGLYGVILAIVQHNLKRLLAYHSIENIGIIGIGIGIGCIGLGTGNPVMASLGFAGALLHTLNHALFKSLLFYAAGNVYQAAHTLDIEKLGGLIKRMPQTAILFLIAAIAICGIPPFNGFISEFILYSGLYNWLLDSTLAPLLVGISSAAGLALIGGLALLCFTKAFGVVFLGTARSKIPDTCTEAPFIKLLPMYLLVALMLLIGVFPLFFIQLLSKPVHLFTDAFSLPASLIQVEAFTALQPIGWAAWLFILLVTGIFFIRKYVLRHRKVNRGLTWGCGYIAPSVKQQYTAGSFVRTYSKLYALILLIEKHEKEIHGIFPAKGAAYQTHPYDTIEKWLIDAPLKLNKTFMSQFVFLNNGNLQFYILYGVIFILAVVSIPLVYTYLVTFILFLKQL